MHGEHREEQIGVKNMRVIILENCVVEGSVWFAGEEVFVDEALGAMMVQAGKAREEASKWLSQWALAVVVGRLAASGPGRTPRADPSR